MTTTDQPTRTQGTDGRSAARTPRRNALGVVGFGVACMVACSLPLLIGGGVAAALGAFLSGAGPLAAVLAAAGAGGTAWWLVRHRARAAASVAAAGSSCGCGSAGC